MLECVLCGEPSDLFALRGPDNVFWIACPICGNYAITSVARDKLKGLDLDSRELLNLFAYTYSQRQSETNFFPLLWKCRGETAEFPNAPEKIQDIEDFVDVPIQHAQKPNELLRLLATKISKGKPFDDVRLSIADIRGIKIGWMEVAYWVQLLDNLGFVEGGRGYALVWNENRDMIYAGKVLIPLRLTPAGWTHAEELFGNVASTTVFIAMSFTLPERTDCQKAIEEACRATGWTAKTVDQEEYAGGVMDKILALINQARFVVADYTENKAGVYYEAGYAEGRGLQVICTVKDGHMEKVHFDTRHLNFIVWKTPDELKDRLRARIGAVINK